MDDSYIIDEELLQWLNNLPPPTPTPPAPEPAPPQQPPHCGGSNAPTLNNVATFVAGSSSGDKGGKEHHQSHNKLKSVEIERQRRQEMSALYASLRSMLPAEYIRGKRSAADHLQEAVKYIKDMESNIAKLNEKRNILLKGKSSISDNTNSNTNTNTVNNTNNNINLKRQCVDVSVKKCRQEFFEIIIKTNNNNNNNNNNSNNNIDYNYEDNLQRLPLSRGIHVLSKEGFCVTNSISTRVGNDVMHTIHIQVNHGKFIDESFLQKQLIECYM